MSDEGDISVNAELRQIAKYTVVGTAVCGSAAGIVGYLVLDLVSKEIENNLAENKLPMLLFFLKPFTRLLIKLLPTLKLQGVRGCVLQGSVFGAFSGAALGVVKIGVVSAYRQIKLRFSEKKK
jgi:hypothetical protein